MLDKDKIIIVDDVDKSVYVVRSGIDRSAGRSSWQHQHSTPMSTTTTRTTNRYAMLDVPDRRQRRRRRRRYMRHALFDWRLSCRNRKQLRRQGSLRLPRTCALTAINVSNSNCSISPNRSIHHQPIAMAESTAGARATEAWRSRIASTRRRAEVRLHQSRARPATAIRSACRQRQDDFVNRAASMDSETDEIRLNRWRWAEKLYAPNYDTFFYTIQDGSCRLRIVNLSIVYNRESYKLRIIWRAPVNVICWHLGFSLIRFKFTAIPVYCSLYKRTSDAVSIECADESSWNGLPQCIIVLIWHKQTIL